MSRTPRKIEQTEDNCKIEQTGDNCKMTELCVDFTPTRYTPREIRYEIPAILTNRFVKLLQLPINRLDVASTKCIVMMLERDDVGPQIEELHLSHTQYEDEDKNRRHIRDEEKPFNQIISSLKSNTSVKKVVISNTALSSSDVSAVSSMLYDVTALKTLDLRHCGIDHKSATKLSCALASNKSVESVSLSDNPISNRGASSLGVALEINSTIKKLKLSGTRIGIEGAVAIGAALAGNSCSLEVLDISRNSIGDMGVSKIAVALKSNKSLRQLSLRQTAMSDVGALCVLLSLYDTKNLGAVLNCNHGIRYINLGNNEVGRKSLLGIDAACSMNLLVTEKETVRQKVSYFLNDESKVSCFGEAMILPCMPSLLSAIGSTNNINSLYNVMKHLHMPALYEPKPLLNLNFVDSIFSDETNFADQSKRENISSIPAFVNVKPR